MAVNVKYVDNAVQADPSPHPSSTNTSDHLPLCLNPRHVPSLIVSR